MLRSILVHLKALDKGFVPPLLAPAIHAEFIKWLPEEARDHSNSERRPFTVSDLRGSFDIEPGGWRRIGRGQRVSFRLTFLKDLGAVLPQVGQELTLADIRFQFQQVSIDDGEWAREISYKSLVDRYAGSGEQASELVKVRFESPATFHVQDDIHEPLPAPLRVFDSWLTRWMQFSPIKTPYGVSNLDHARVAISEYDLKTHGVKYAEAMWIGFTGYCHFRIFSTDVGTVKLANLLADFAFYCGTGAKTSFGLGQTRRLR
ncbi:MAG: CRISPR system precrRNA processing endoribonuclease RAMP protein Cas6 [Chloroflexota bacterium]